MILRLRTYSIAGLLAMGVILLMAGCGDDSTSSTTSSTATWTQQTSLPSTPGWWQIFGFSASDMFIVGEDGLAYRGSGNSWDSLNSTTSSNHVLYSVWGTSPTDVYVAGVEFDAITDSVLDTLDDSSTTMVGVLDDLPVLAHYNGVNFNAINLGDSRDALYNIWGSSDSNVVVVGNHGRIIRYDGHDWTFVTDSGTVRLLSAWGSSDTVVYAVGRYGTALRYNLRANTLKVLNTGTNATLWFVHGFSDSDIYAGGDGGVILHWNGQKWSRMDSPTENALYSAWSISSDNMYLSGASGTILHWNGSTFTEQATGTDFLLLTIWGTDEANIYAAGETTIRYTGGDWEPFEVRPVPTFTDIWSRSSSETVIVGTRGTIFYTNGSAWTALKSGSTEDLLGVWGDVSSGDRFAVGEHGTVLKSNIEDTTYFKNWDNISPGTGVDLNAVWGFSDTSVVVVGDNGTILRYDGTDWSSDVSGVTDDLNDVWGVGDTLLYAVGDAPVLLRYHNGWDTLNAPDGTQFNSVWGFAADDIIMVGDNGVILRYNGADWTQMTSPTNWNLTSVWGTGAGDVFVAGERGLIFHYDGSAWTQAEMDVTADLNAVYGVSSTLVFAGGANNHLLKYTD